MKSRILLSGFVVALLFLVACSPKSLPKDTYRIQKQVAGNKGIVVCAHPLASAVGADILSQGGNAIDAAVAVQLALAVVYPGAGNIGGGGFLVYREAGGEATTLDFREKAPVAAHRDMYLDKDGNPVMNLSTIGHLAVGVPGTIDGIFEMFEKYSKLKNFSLLIQPAIDLASKGFRITEREADQLNEHRAQFLKVNHDNIPFVKETKWRKGDLLVQTELASTLERIKENGRGEFYEGQTAKLIVKCMAQNKGIITEEDLENYKSVWRQAVKGRYKSYKIITMPPPSSGGILLLQMLKMIEYAQISKLSFHSKEHVHLVTEAERRAYADRAAYFGDPDFTKTNLKHLLDYSYIKSRMKSYCLYQATPSSSIAAGVMPLPHEREETTHISIIDKDGNAVSLTTTLNGSYGSMAVVPGGGFLLNNEMDDFSIKPGVPNIYGLVGGEANAIQPGKRMLSSMTPTIVLKDDKLYAIIGSPGGSTIITTVLQIIMNLVDFELNPYDAVQAPRFHSQWLPDKIFLESSCLDYSTRSALKEMGHSIEERSKIGRVEAIVKYKGKYMGVADERGDDEAEAAR